MINQQLKRLELESEYYSLYIDNNHVRMDFPDSSLFYVRRVDFKFSLTTQTTFAPYSIIHPSNFNVEFITFEGTEVVIDNNSLLITLSNNDTISVASNSGYITVNSDTIYNSIELYEDKVLTDTLLNKWKCSTGYGNSFVSNLVNNELKSYFRMDYKVIIKYNLGGNIYDNFVVGEDNTPLLSTAHPPYKNTLGEIFG